MKYKKTIVEIAVFLAVSALLVFVLPRFVIERIIVDGSSMETTLQHKDNVLVEKVSRYFGALERFDIIVFYPDEKAKKEGGRYYIKRVIGLPGETVQITDGVIYIDGEPLSEAYGSTALDYAGLAAKPITLGDEEYFVLGDNRSGSKDSRSPEVGNVPLSRVGGKLMIRIFPFDKFGTVN